MDFNFFKQGNLLKFKQTVRDRPLALKGIEEDAKRLRYYEAYSQPVKVRSSAAVSTYASVYGHPQEAAARHFEDLYRSSFANMMRDAFANGPQFSSTRSSFGTTSFPPDLEAIYPFITSPDLTRNSNND